MNIPKIINNNFNPEKARKAITTLGKSGTLLPIILLETTVTGGRTLQAYKRDGYTEARERFCEESVGAVFWLFGVKMFNKLGDSFGKHFLKIPVTEFDVGKDALRTPFENVTEDLAKKSGQVEKGIKTISKEALAGFKFGKIILSVIAATSFIGFVVPKINQSITRKVISRNKTNEPKVPNAQMSASVGSIDDFKKKVTDKKPTFKGGMLNADLLATVAHDLENHPVYRLLATDVGILSGRTINSRNNDERVEVIFRDGVSIYFYMFCTKHIINLLQKITKSEDISKLDPMSAKHAHEMISEQIKNVGGNMSTEEFKTKVLGSLSEESKSIVDQIPFDKDVIPLKELIKHIPEKFHAEAKAMSGLQPAQAKLGQVLTRLQVEDVLKEGSITSSEFLTKMYTESFGKDLVNPYKYIPMKSIQSFRKNIDSYVKAIVDYAEKNNKNIIDAGVLEKMNKSNLVKFGGFFGTGFLISALFLSTIIPKTQYLITKLRTGKNQFPGMEDDGARQKLTSK